MATGASPTSAEIHLKRAWNLIQEVEKATESLRNQAVRHDAQINEDQPFIAGMLNTVRSTGGLNREKASLQSDLQLAEKEIDAAVRLNVNASIKVDSADFTPKTLRALIFFLMGEIEMIWGKSEAAISLFQRSAEVGHDFGGPHYMIGLIYEGEYKPKEALQEFEKCLELDPDGEFSVGALREANAMRNYKKKFRGNWILLIVLTFFYIIPGVIYWYAKYK